MNILLPLLSILFIIILYLLVKIFFLTKDIYDTFGYRIIIIEKQLDELERQVRKLQDEFEKNNWDDDDIK